MVNVEVGEVGVIAIPEDRLRFLGNDSSRFWGKLNRVAYTLSVQICP
jgi:hypothetical protein